MLKIVIVDVLIVLTFSKRKLKLLCSVTVLTPTKDDSDDTPTSARRAEIFVISLEKVENTRPKLVLSVENITGTNVDSEDNPGPAKTAGRFVDM